MQLKDLFDDFPLNEESLSEFSFRRLLEQPLDVFSSKNGAERLLLKARDAMPKSKEVLVALYKLYAYTDRLDDSLCVIKKVLEDCALEEGLPLDWRLQQGDSDCWQEVQGAIRCYLYTLKAACYVNMKKDNMDEAHAIMLKLQELDPNDEVGGSVVFDIVEALMDN